MEPAGWGKTPVIARLGEDTARRPKVNFSRSRSPSEGRGSSSTSTRSPGGRSAEASLEQFRRLLHQLEQQFVQELTIWSRENQVMRSELSELSCLASHPLREKERAEETSQDVSEQSPVGDASLQLQSLMEGDVVVETKPLSPLGESAPPTRQGSDAEVEDVIGLSVASVLTKEEKPSGERWSRCLQSDLYELMIGLLIIVNSLIMAVEFEFQGYMVGHSLAYPRMHASPDEVWPAAQQVFDNINLIFTLIFVVDIVVRVTVLRSQFFRQPLNWLDLLVVGCSVLEILFVGLLPLDTVFVRLLRLGKVARAVRVVRHTEGMSSLIMLLKCVQASFNTLCWSLSFIMVLQCIAGMVISQVVSPYMKDDTVDAEARRAVFRYYGTFTSTFLTMFEVLLANWAPAARILVDNVSDIFVYVFVVYRCVVGFAILNVVNAVFIQQTMKVAQADQELIIKQRLRAESAYASKMRQFFEKLDTSHCGFLTWKDFHAALQKPELRSWMATLDLETYDLVNLFHLIDDGDGRITVAEFLDGAIRLRGLAKSVDLAQVLNTTRRVDAKIEALLMAMKDLHGESKVDNFREQAIGKMSKATTRRLSFHKRKEEQEAAEAAAGMTRSYMASLFRMTQKGPAESEEKQTPS